MRRASQNGRLISVPVAKYITMEPAMLEKMREDARLIIEDIIRENMPQESVQRALRAHAFGDSVHVVAIGKAAWAMAKTAADFLGGKLARGVVITKYGHSLGDIPGMKVFEAGHPTPDENSVRATQSALALAEGLKEDDELLFLVSGGGSALFEAPPEGVSIGELAALTGELLACGADIVEVNMVRKRLSRVKAGRFARACSPAGVFSVVLSDVLGDRLDSIASGPAAPDNTTAADALAVVEKYGIRLTETQRCHLAQETPKTVENVKTVVTGGVRSLCESAAKAARSLGYAPYVLTTVLNCEASEAGRFLSCIAADTQNGTNSFGKPCAIIAGGETVVRVKGQGKGGRNQELALAAAKGIATLENTLVFSLGSDGTDGPTDAAGGMVDCTTLARLRGQNLDIDKILENNDAYHGLKAVDGLIVTGPTGTNVNDVSVALCGPS